MSAIIPVRPEQSRRAPPDHPEHSQRESPVRPEHSRRKLVEGHPLCERLPLLASAPGGIKKLRELILELAVRGKLVPQDPSDEPASELLKRCGVEKARLIAGETIKKSKPLPNISEEEKEFALPLGWEWIRAGQIVHSQAGFAFKSHGFNEAGIGLPLIRIRDVGQSAPTTYYDGDYRDEFLVECGDYLVSMDGQFRVAAWEGAPGLLNQRVTRLVFFGNECAPAFIAASLQGKLAFLQGVKAYTTVDHLSGKQIAEAVIGLPPVTEQRRIVAKVDELMTLCDRLEAQQADAEAAHATLVKILLDTLIQSQSAADFAANWQRLSAHFDTLFTTESSIDALKQTLLQLAVMGKLVPQDLSDEPAHELLKRIHAKKIRLATERRGNKNNPLSVVGDEERLFELAENWAWVRLGDLVLHSEAGWSPSCQKTPAEEGEWGVLKVSAVSWGEFRSKENKALPAHLAPRPEYEVQEGDFLVSRANTAELVARGVVVRGVRPRLMLSDKIVRLRLSWEVNVQYCQIVNASAWSRAYYAQAAGGTSGSMKNVSRQQILALVVPLPSRKEQDRIASAVEAITTLCKRLQAQLNDVRLLQERLAECLVKQAVSVTRF